MSRICQITGKKAMTGNSVSHSNAKTKRRFNPNLQQKRFYVPEEKKWITLKVSTSGLKIINRRGIYACLQEARAKGFLHEKPAKKSETPTPASHKPANPKPIYAAKGIVKGTKSK